MNNRSSPPPTTGPLPELDVDRLEAALFPNYRRAGVAFVRGVGARLFTEDGRDFVDLLAGIATSTLGHAHPGLAKALSEQASRLLHVSNLYQIPEQSEAAERLCEATGGVLRRAFFCNSGAEANEALIKLARLWGHEDGRFEVITNQGAFHGRTFGALAATGTPAYRVGFEPLPEGFVHVPFGDVDAVRDAIGERTCAVLLEAVQGEGGVYPNDRDDLRRIEELCRERGVLFLLDEVQTGIGRLGTMYGFQHFGLRPDAISLAKGLGGGVPVGAVLASEDLASRLVPGKHGSTFGGNPLAMRAVTAVQEALLDEGILEGVGARAERLRAGLESLMADFEEVEEVRGIGLMQALRFAEGIEAGPLAVACLEHGVLVNAVRPDALRFLPPLNIEHEELEEGLSRVSSALRASLGAVEGVGE